MTTRSVLDHDLKAIRDNIVRMGDMVNEAASKALDAFTRQDSNLARAVIENDDKLDDLHIQIEKDITSTMALQQPMASDLRRLVGALLISNELERMGDYAEGMAGTVLNLSSDDPIEIPTLLSEMKAEVSRMIQAVMEAYVNEDIPQARAAHKMDDELDVRYKELFSMLVTQMGTGALSIKKGTYLLWAGHNLERIGDRVTNIAERIMYIQTGDLGEIHT